MNDYGHGFTDQTPAFILISHGCVKDSYNDAFIIDWDDTKLVFTFREDTIIVPWHAVVLIQYQTPDQL